MRICSDKLCLISHGDDPDPVRLLDDPSYARAAADTMQALATPSRLRILARLQAGPAPVSELARSVGMEGSAVSHQLRLLRHLRLVTGERVGRQIVYALHDDHVAELLDQVVAHVEHVRLGLTGRHPDASRTPADPGHRAAVR